MSNTNHHAPVTREEEVLESLKRLSEIELQTVINALYVHLKKCKTTHIFVNASGMDLSEEIYNIVCDIDDIQEKLDDIAKRIR